MKKCPSYPPKKETLRQSCCTIQKSKKRAKKLRKYSKNMMMNDEKNYDEKNICKIKAFFWSKPKLLKQSELKFLLKN
jgi:hypothetical protein